MRDGRSAEQAGSFGRSAAEYERARPTYPAEVARWMVPTGAEVVLDLGAGTGKFTRSLLDLDVELIAVEPLDEMRAVIEAELPSVRALPGSAEAIPLPDASVDVITVAQAWHWVDEPRALAEAARVLRPGGSLAIVWNLRDEATPWIRRLSEILDHSPAEATVRGDFTIGAPFGPTERFHMPWTRPMTVDSLVELAASRSYVITSTPAEREAILAGVRNLALTDPDLAGREPFDMPYGTFAFRAALD